jgi:hypothetical protein
MSDGQNDDDKPVAEFIEGLFAEVGSVSGSSAKAKQHIWAGVMGDIKSEAERAIQWCHDDLNEKRQALHLSSERYLAAGEKIIEEIQRDLEAKKAKIYELDLSVGRTPKHNGKVGNPRKGFLSSKDYLRASKVLEIDDAHYAAHGVRIKSQAKCIRVCQKNGEPYFGKGVAANTLQRSVATGLRKYFPDAAKARGWSKKPS